MLHLSQSEYELNQRKRRREIHESMSSDDSVVLVYY